MESDWARTYGGDDNEYGYDADQTSDGGFILVGTQSIDYHSSVLLVKTAADGSEEWTRIHEDDNLSQRGLSVEQTSDSGYIIAGKSSIIYDYDRGDFLLMKTDQNGVVEWEKTFDNGYYECATRVRQTSGGGYIILGGSSVPTFNESIYIVKTDMYGNMEWSVEYTGAVFEIGREIVETADSGFVVLKSTMGSGDSETALIKFDMNGNLLWERLLWIDDLSRAFMDLTTDGGFIIAGSQWSDTYDTNIRLVKTDSDGVEQWSKTFGSEFIAESGLNVKQTNDNGYIVLTQSYENDGYTLVLLKTDADGNESWQKEVAPEFPVKDAYSLELTSGGGYIMAGSIGVYLDRDAMLIRAFPPALSEIVLLAPPDMSFQASPPTFQWLPNGGREVAYAVDFAFSSNGPFYSTYEDLHIVLTEPKWTVPLNIWNQVPSGKWILWRVRGLDLGASPKTVITSDQRFFYRW
jgi:hypothetical protein